MAGFEGRKDRRRVITCIDYALPIIPSFYGALKVQTAATATAKLTRKNQVGENEYSHPHPNLNADIVVILVKLIL